MLKLHTWARSVRLVMQAYSARLFNSVVSFFKCLPCSVSPTVYSVSFILFCFNRGKSRGGGGGVAVILKNRILGSSDLVGFKPSIRLKWVELFWIGGVLPLPVPSPTQPLKMSLKMDHVLVLLQWVETQAEQGMLVCSLRNRHPQLQSQRGLIISQLKSASSYVNSEKSMAGTSGSQEIIPFLDHYVAVMHRDKMSL